MILKMDPAERAVLDQVIGWRRMRMSWQAVGRSLGVTSEAARAKYEGLTVPAPQAPSRAAEAWCKPRVEPLPVASKRKREPVKPRVRPEVKAPGSKPRRARSVAAPLDLTPETVERAIRAAVVALGLPEAAATPGVYGHRRARLAAAVGYCAWTGSVKRDVGQAFDVHHTLMAPSGLTAWSITHDHLTAIVAALCRVKA